MNQWRRGVDKTSWNNDICGISHTPSGVFLLILFWVMVLVFLSDYQH